MFCMQLIGIRSVFENIAIRQNSQLSIKWNSLYKVNLGQIKCMYFQVMLCLAIKHIGVL